MRSNGQLQAVAVELGFQSPDACNLKSPENVLNMHVRLMGVYFIHYLLRDSESGHWSADYANYDGGQGPEGEGETPEAAILSAFINYLEEYKKC